MLVVLEDVTLNSVWRESFIDRDGREVEFFRALCTVPGEQPAQLSVMQDDFDSLTNEQGNTGTAHIEIQARPGSRARVILRGLD